MKTESSNGKAPKVAAKTSTKPSANGKVATEAKAATPTKTKKVVKKKTTDLSMNQADLSRRLGSNPSTLSRHANKGESHFAQWSKAKDPDHLAWKFSGVKNKSKFFAPIK